MDLDVTASLSFSFRKSDSAGRVVVRHHYDNPKEDYGLCAGAITTVPTFSFWPGIIQWQISTKTAGTLVTLPINERARVQAWRILCQASSLTSAAHPSLREIHRLGQGQIQRFGKKGSPTGGRVCILQKT